MAVKFLNVILHKYNRYIIFTIKAQSVVPGVTHLSIYNQCHRTNYQLLLCACYVIPQQSRLNNGKISHIILQLTKQTQVNHLGVQLQAPRIPRQLRAYLLGVILAWKLRMPALPNPLIHACMQPNMANPSQIFNGAFDNDILQLRQHLPRGASARGGRDDRA